MDINEHTTPAKLERYAFLWLLLSLVISALAMFMGARPPLTLIMGYSAWSLLNLSWLISGAAAGYLTYRYAKNNKTVFGGKDKRNVIAFNFMLASGFNLGLTGLFGNNIYLSLVYGQLAYVVTGIVCLIVAYQLHKSWKGNGEVVFKTSVTAGSVVPEASSVMNEYKSNETNPGANSNEQNNN